MSVRGRPVLALADDELTPRAWLGGLLGPSLPDAACSGRSPLWDADLLQGETTHQMRVRQAGAALICQACPVREPCATDAAEDPYAYGVRGGELYGRPGRARQRRETA